MPHTPFVPAQAGTQCLWLLGPCFRGDERLGSAMTDSGRLAENILYFARALRAAGIPVGPGAVIDALEAVNVAAIGEQRGFLLDAARGVREAARAHHPVRPGLQAVLPQARLYRAADRRHAAGGRAHPAEGAAGRHPARAGGALWRAQRAQAAGTARGRARRAADRLRPRGAAEEGFRADDGGRDRRRQGGDRAAGAAARSGAHAQAGRGAARPHDRYPPHAARQHEGGRRGDRPEISRVRARRSRRSWRSWIFPAR